MNAQHLLLLLPVALVGWMLLRARPGIQPAEAARRVAAGTAVLIDVREPGEWASGVAAPARLMALSALHRDRRSCCEAIAGDRDREIILYCHSGMRSAAAARLLRREGFRTVNLGGFSAWRAAGLPVRTPA